MQRSLLLFENSIKIKATRTRYLYHLNKFRKFYKIKDYDSLLIIDIKKLQIMVEDYVMMLKKKVSPNSINSYMGRNSGFL
ncbi:MAG: hypothetical protein OEM28_08500 [Nitrosopumilus sp.]|nr:hypothetical protein [Nitrosopumilus sp.]MDH3487890.1 hypothetical protein [Nitrosopumilus sp.]